MMKLTSAPLLKTLLILIKRAPPVRIVPVGTTALYMAPVAPGLTQMLDSHMRSCQMMSCPRILVDRLGKPKVTRCVCRITHNSRWDIVHRFLRLKNAHYRTFLCFVNPRTQTKTLGLDAVVCSGQLEHSCEIKTETAI